MKPTQTVISQHWVPRCYLAAWSDSDNKIWMFDRLQQKTARPNVEGVACGRYFYDTDALKDTSKPELFQAVEKLLADIEGKCAGHFRRLSETAELTVRVAQGEKLQIKPPLTKMGRHNLAGFIALQYFRTSDMRAFHEETFTKVSQRIMEETLPIQFPDLAPSNYQIKIAEDYIKGLHIEALLSFTDYIPYFRDKYWVFAVNIHAEPFVTSDNPVVKLPTKIDPSIPHDGLDSFGMRLVYPVSPKLSITMYDKKAFPPFAKWDGQVRFVTQETVAQYNLLQLENCSRQIYSSVDSFDFAKGACAADPDLCKPKTDRFIPMGPAIDEMVAAAVRAADEYKSDPSAAHSTHDQS